MIDAYMQVAALCVHGNALLQGRLDNFEALQQSSVVSCCETFRFERTTPGYRGASIAATPAAWLRRMVSEDVSSFRYCTAKHDFSRSSRLPQIGKFVGILVEGAAGIELWTPDWTFRGQRPDGKNWKVGYGSERVSRHLFNPPPAVSQMGDRLNASMERFADASIECGYTNWSKRLQSLRQLSSTPGSIPTKFEETFLMGLLPADSKIAVANAVRSHVLLASNEYEEFRKTESPSRAFIEAESLLWKAIVGTYESTIFRASGAQAQAA